jgi:ribulose-phosphate 3-epimerase
MKQMMNKEKDKSVFISPSILAADFSRLGDEVSKVLELGADMIHFDVMDGVFVPNLSLGIPVVESLRKRFENVFFDVHLMIVEPERYVLDFVKAGGNLITFHIEATRHPHRVIEMIKKAGAKAGVALNPGTPVIFLKEIFDILDAVLVMSVNPGFYGQSFIPSSLKKISELDVIRKENGFDFLIEVDGGLNEKNVERVISAGANILVFGAFLFKGATTENFRYIVDKIRISK